ncbi:FAD/FMN-containing dehydrogenase [Singulisphaera sp. GP187]|uniref:FAD-binding oxidoreductase n=1 Tax=Singulisphaera sp. GP187 TaxID=1882752 RepID=UPI0009266BFD|nr:FAD-binding oxidoreductase [Singulisphaera sp. GP187]SIN86915.1 FAD/FMN-containing dehydrogenase [Singulisphaera sp. GP187]
MHNHERDAWILDMVQPWTLADVLRDESARSVVYWLARPGDSPLTCPECERPCAGYDSQPRRWRLLDEDQFQTVLEGNVPRCSCPEHGVNPIRVPWAEPGHPIAQFVECSDPGASEGDPATRRGFLASTVAAAGSLLVGGAVFPEEGAGAEATVTRAEPDWGALRRRIKGEVVTPNDPDFASVRSSLVWNKIKPDRSPDVIVRVKNEQDVVEAINFARENGLKVVNKGGGHTWCGLSVRHGGMTIDLSGLNESWIDEATQTAVIQPVISNRELARRLGEHNLAFPIGHCPTVKAGGYLLNGGMSWNMGHWGPACLSVEAVEFVTADGKMIKASATEHQDLYWAARGCGPGMFAVATRFHLKCYPLPKAIATSNYFYSLNDLKAAVDEVVALGRTMPDNVELSIFLIKAPAELAEACKDHNGKVCMVVAVAFGMTKEESEAALAPLEQGTVVKKALARTFNEPTDFEGLSIASGESWPENHRNLCENQCSKARPSDMLMALRDKFVEAPSAKSVIVFCQSTGSRNLLEPNPEVALSIDATSYGGSWAIWEDEADDAANRKWQDEVIAIMKPFTSQHYIGETDYVQDPARVQESYSAEKWKRLEEVRAKYDPQGLFFGFLGGTRKA